MKKEDFKNKKVIITGASGGIGQAIVKVFAERGAEILAISRSDGGLSKLSNVQFLSADVSGVADLKNISRLINGEWGGRVDILVNAAGIYGPMGPLEDNDLELWSKTIAVNLLGTVNMCRLVIPIMKAQKFGRIINFSGGGEGAFPNFTAYSASKGAIVRFTESLAEELKDFGITVNAIAPGAVNTQLLDQVLSAGPEKIGKNFYKKSLKQKSEGGVSPEKAAETILFLASDAASSLSGKIISAVWDNQKTILEHLKEIQNSDIYNFRRIKPKDRGYEW